MKEETGKLEPEITPEEPGRPPCELHMQGRVESQPGARQRERFGVGPGANVTGYRVAGGEMQQKERNDQGDDYE